MYEVGFLVGMFVVRPKVYLKSQRGSVINMMDSGQYWLAIYGRGLQDAVEHLTMDTNKRTLIRSFDLLTGGTLQPRSMDMKYQHWQTLRENGLTQMDFWNFTQSYGGDTRQDEGSPNLHRPELICWRIVTGKQIGRAHV